MAQAVNWNLTAFGNGSAFIIAYIKKLDGTDVRLADLSTIRYTIYALGERGNSPRQPVTGHTGVLLDKEAVFSDDVLTGVFDGTERYYNFRLTLDNSVDECFPEANSKYLIRIDFKPYNGFISPIQIMVSTI